MRYSARICVVGGIALGAACSDVPPVTGPVEMAASYVSQAWTAIDIGNLGYEPGWISVWGIGPAGEIVGGTSVENGDAPYVWSGGNMTSLGTLGGDGGEGYAINASGQVAGHAAAVVWNGPDSFSIEYHAFLWTNGVMTDLGTLGGAYSEAHDINDAGQIVGGSTTADGETHAFLWQDGVMTDLGTLGGESSHANGINSRGEIVGHSGVAIGSKISHGFIWRDGVMTDLGTLSGDPSSSSIAQSINDAGMVVGGSYDFATYPGTHNRAPRAVAWENGSVYELGTLGGGDSYAWDVNDGGEVVGYARDALGRERPFLWRNGTMTDIGTLGGPSGQAKSINDSGRIAGETLPAVDYMPHGTLWLPGPAPLTVPIDVRHDDPTNTIPCNDPDFVIRVAILTNDRFRAATLDPNTVRFAGAAEMRRRDDGSAVQQLTDVDRDRDLDMIVRVRLRDTNLDCQSTVAALEGATTTGQPIVGTDVVNMKR